MNHFLDIDVVDTAALHGILVHAKGMKTLRSGRPRGTPDDTTPLSGRIVALVFEKPSTRTRVSFDVGVRQLGGETLVLSGSDMQLGRGESAADTARVLSRYVDMIVIRTTSEENILEFAEYADIPVINGLTDRSHPCQVMGDVLTFQERQGAVKGRRIAWIGDGNNVCTSFLHAAGQFGFDMSIACPEGFEPSASAVEFARGKGINVDIARDPKVSAAGADLIVTDAWMSMHDTEFERSHRRCSLAPYQVTEELLSVAGEDAVFMHCLPAYRGEEVTAAVLDGPASVVLDEAENRLHVQKAIMRYCLEV